MTARPRIADVQCSRLKFEPGDRILVKSRHKLDPYQQKQIKKSIQKWAGTDIEVLIYCEMDLSIEIAKAERRDSGLIVPNS